MFRLKWQKRKKDQRRPVGRGSPTRSVTARRLFHGVSIMPEPVNACDAAIAQSNVRYLADEAPMLPLAECTRRADCHCKYRHFDDRRTEARRESDVGLPVKNHPNDARTGYGRRVTDG